MIAVITQSILKIAYSCKRSASSVQMHVLQKSANTSHSEHLPARLDVCIDRLIESQNFAEKAASCGHDDRVMCGRSDCTMPWTCTIFEWFHKLQR